MKNLGVLLFLLMICAVPVVFAQSAESSNPAIHGQGTAGKVSKFTAQTVIGDTAIYESNGCMSESETFDVSFATTLCLHDLGGNPDGRKAVELSSLFPDWPTLSIRSLSESGSATAVFAYQLGADGGIGVHGRAGAATGTGTGVLGEAFSPNGMGMFGVNQSTTGDPVGVMGVVGSNDRGIGVRGAATSATGNGIGVLGEAYSAAGTAGVFNAISGGTILNGIANSSENVFRVDITGKVFANGGFQTGGADFAESLPVSGDRHQYQPGDLLVIDRASNRRLTLADTPYSPLVAGIYSTKPGMLASPYAMDDPKLRQEVPMAVVGIVPCKVSTENGAIEVGDLLVASSTPGHAMKGTDRNKMLGAVVGKALEPLREGKGVVQVLVTLQ